MNKIAKAVALLFLVSISLHVHSQEKEKKEKVKISLRDSLDHRFDLSDWLMDESGFMPVATFITEPALGGFGFVAAPVFVKKRAPININGKAVPQPPDMTAVMGGYTLNKSWFTGAGRIATFPRARLRYKILSAYTDINLTFYRDIQGEEHSFDFNGKMVPVYLSLARILKKPKWTVGGQYIFAYARVGMEDGSELPDFVEEKEAEGFLSMFGLSGEFDSRDNIFTPDKGIKAHVNMNVCSHIFGSDYDYQHLSTYLYWYQPLGRHWKNGKNWISAMRFDMQQMFGDPPFYLVSSISMRGIPIARYQGKTNLLMETEQRWDFVRRWSVVFFGGVGKAFNSYSEFPDAKLVYSYGGGFRYFIARKFKMRMGIDVAGGPDNWGYYIVFGNSWLRL